MFHPVFNGTWETQGNRNTVLTQQWWTESQNDKTISSFPLAETSSVPVLSLQEALSHWMALMAQRVNNRAEHNRFLIFGRHEKMHACQATRHLAALAEKSCRPRLRPFHFRVWFWTRSIGTHNELYQQLNGRWSVDGSTKPFCFHFHARNGWVW